jgi:hypothetical protein
VVDFRRLNEVTVGDSYALPLIGEILDTLGKAKYEGESNENRKTEIKIRNIASMSYKLADMLPML